MTALGDYPASQVVNDWHFLNWLVKDVDNAWACALDIEAWLTVRHAGEGQVKLVSGIPGEIGAGYLHTNLSLREAVPSFKLYHVIDINRDELKIQMKVQTDLASWRLSEGGAEFQLSIDPSLRSDGFFVTTLSESCDGKKFVKHHKQPHFRKHYQGLSLALCAHFDRYRTRDLAILPATALPGQ